MAEGYGLKVGDGDIGAALKQLLKNILAREEVSRGAGSGWSCRTAGRSCRPWSATRTGWTAADPLSPAYPVNSARLVRPPDQETVRKPDRGRHAAV